MQGVALFSFVAFCASLFVKLTLKSKCTFKIEVQERRSLFAKTNIGLKVLRIKGKVLYLQNQKLVPMKKEIGKWLMDIAKYITTAVLLSAVFRDMESPWVVIGGISAAMGTLAWGLYLIPVSYTHLTLPTILLV